MEANLVIQVALLAVLPLLMQGLKKNIGWVEMNKAWFCPFLCIAASTVAAYFLKLPQWLLVGILTGASCNKIYDWSKDIKASMIILLLILPALVLGGCNKLVKWDSAHDKHVRATYAELNRSYALCQAGDANQCSMCLAMAAAETKYIKAGLEDANKPVTMDADFKSKFLILNAQLNRFNELCLGGDSKACQDGARNGVNGIGVILNAVDDVNSSAKWK